MADTVFVSFLPYDLSWLFLADRLIALPLGVFAIAVATVLLPDLSRNSDDMKKVGAGWLGVELNVLDSDPFNCKSLYIWPSLLLS